VRKELYQKSPFL